MNVLRRVIVGVITAAVLLVTPGLVGVAAADDGGGNGSHSCHDGGRTNGSVDPDNTCPNGN